MGYNESSNRRDRAPIVDPRTNYDLEALHTASNLRRSLGTYYTAERIADAVASWAITDSEFAILDPSFGGCSFLRSSVKRLLELGATEPGPQVFGIDIDPATSPYGDALTALGVPQENLRYQDFFRIRPDAFPNRFDAIVGNPPYIRHHRLTEQIIESARQRACAVDIPLDGRSDAWAYFVAHSLSFLEQGGRLAYLLPGAVLHADYSKPLLRALSNRFRQVQLIQLQERVFDARENTTVLLANGFREGRCSLALGRISTANDLMTLLEGQDCFESSSLPLKGQAPNAALLDEEALQLWTGLQALSRVDSLGSVADVRIGVVTGANSFFLRAHQEAMALQSEGATTVSILPSSRYLHGATWRKGDQRTLEEEGKRAHLLVLPEDLRAFPGLIDLVAEARDHGLSGRSHCRKRDPWYVLRDLEVPHAFLKYMSGGARGLVLNHARVTCTNSIHRVDFVKGAWASRYSVIASSWSSLWRLALEIRGRPYGGGVLKIEPSAAKHLPIVQDVDRARDIVEAIEKASRSGDLNTARQRANEMVLQRALGLSKREVSVLSAAANELENARSALPPKS